MFLCYFIWSYYEDGDEDIIMDSTILDIPYFDPYLENFSLDVFPNPATERITLSGETSTSGKHSFTIIDGAGKTVFQETKTIIGSSFLESFDVNELSSGVYFVQCESEGKIGIRKFVIE